MVFWKRGEAARERAIEVSPEVERVRKRFASGNPRVLKKADERVLRSEFTRVVGLKAAERADWVVLWHEPAFRFVKEVEIRRTIGSTHQTKKGELLYVIPDAQDNFDPYMLIVVDGNGEEAGYLSMRDEAARNQAWEALLNGRTVLAIPKQNRKLAAALFVQE